MSAEWGLKKYGGSRSGAVSGGYRNTRERCLGERKFRPLRSHALDSLLVGSLNTQLAVMSQVHSVQVQVLRNSSSTSTSTSKIYKYKY